MGTGSLPICAWLSRVRVRVRACCKVECHLGLYYQNRHLRPQRNNDSRFSQLSAWLCLASPSHQDFPPQFLLLVLQGHPHVFDVGEFVVWMEYFTCSISTCLETNSKPYQVPRQSPACHRDR